MADLTSTDRVKRVLGIPAAVTIHDVFIGELADAVDGLVLQHCNQPTLTWATGLVAAFDIERAGESQVSLPAFPVAEVDSVVDAGQTLSGSSWYLHEETGMVRLVGSGDSFTQGRQKVVVTYTAGHTAGSPGLNTLAHAASVWAAAMFNTSPHAGFANEGQGAYRYTLDSDGVPSQVRALLAGHMRIVARDSQP